MEGDTPFHQDSTDGRKEKERQYAQPWTTRTAYPSETSPLDETKYEGNPESSILGSTWPKQRPSLHHIPTQCTVYLTGENREKNRTSGIPTYNNESVCEM